MRKSFWELATKFAGYGEEMSSINQLFNETMVYCHDLGKNLTVKEYIDRTSFHRWMHDNGLTAISIDNLMEKLKMDFFNSQGIRLEFTQEEFLLYAETIYNLVNMKGKAERNIIDVISLINHDIEIDCERLGFEIKKTGEEKYIIVEKNAAATAVADKYADGDLAFSHKVIEYNHFLLRGNIDRKREILLAIGQKFEPIRRRLEGSPFKSVSEDARALLNNLNIRHDNISPEDKTHYNAVVDQMPNGDLEEWYDKTYSVLLLALLADDFSALHKEIKELKAQIESK